MFFILTLSKKIYTFTDYLLIWWFQPTSWKLKVATSSKTCFPVPEIEETQVWSLGREDPLEEGRAIHSSILAWRIPWQPTVHKVAQSHTWLKRLSMHACAHRITVLLYDKLLKNLIFTEKIFFFSWSWILSVPKSKTMDNLLNSPLCLTSILQ